jgi:GNAT superfamily N-acetyltransferase
MKTLIRTFTPHDYEKVVNVYNAAFPDYPITVEEMRHEDEHYQRHPHCQCRRWVAEWDGRIVGAVEHTQRPSRYHPHKFWMRGYVHPDYRHLGIGSALYDRVMTALQAFNPILALCGVEESKPESVQFLQKRGLTEESRHWTSRLALASFDPTPFAQLENQLRAQGIELKTFAELASDPVRNRKLYDLWWELTQDVPASGGMAPTRYGFEQFVEMALGGPNFLAEAYFIAVRHGEYVGSSDLCGGTNGPKLIRTGFTGVKRAYRHRRIALALKLKGIEYAKDHGYETVETTNASINRPMLAINECLGFDKQPAIIVFKKIFRQEST